MRFQDDVVIVTGSGSGMGRAAARIFADEGATVAVNDLKPEVVDEVVAELEAAGGKAVALAGDISDRTFVEDATASLVAAHGKIDVLVNNAGIASHGDAETYDSWDRIIDVDLSGPYHLARAVARQSMIPRRHGAIVNVASLAGLVANPFDVAYIAAKHGLVGLTKALAIEWARYNVRVNCVCPGSTRTGIFAAVEERDPEKFVLRGEKTPLGRWAEPREQATAMAFLASQDASYITGMIMPVDGGQMALSSGWDAVPQLPDPS
jgi:NAD(P)-dependent dehydrogenase (short-subunit alcohol dehydrogenase family)